MYFFRTVTFSEKLILRNQLHSIYIWRDFWLNIIHSFKYTTSWSDFEISQFFIADTAKNVLISIHDVLQIWLFSW